MKKRDEASEAAAWAWYLESPTIGHPAIVNRNLLLAPSFNRSCGCAAANDEAEIDDDLKPEPTVATPASVDAAPAS